MIDRDLPAFSSDPDFLLQLFLKLLMINLQSGPLHLDDNFRASSQFDMIEIDISVATMLKGFKSHLYIFMIINFDTRPPFQFLRYCYQ